MTLSGNFGQKQLFLKVFLDFFSTDTLRSAEVFCVDFSAIRRFLRAIKNQYRAIFLFFFIQRGDPYDLRGGPNVPSPLKMVEK